SYFLTWSFYHPPLGVPDSVYAIVERVAVHYARGGPNKSIGGLLQWTSQHGGRRAEAVIAGLARGWPKDKPPRPDDVDKTLADLFAKLPPGGRAQLLELATRWHSKALEQYSAEIAASLLAQVQDTKA